MGGRGRRLRLLPLLRWLQPLPLLRWLLPLPLLPLLLLFYLAFSGLVVFHLPLLRRVAVLGPGLSSGTGQKSKRQKR